MAQRQRKSVAGDPPKDSRVKNSKLTRFRSNMEFNLPSQSAASSTPRKKSDTGVLVPSHDKHAGEPLHHDVRASVHNRSNMDPRQQGAELIRNAIKDILHPCVASYSEENQQTSLKDINDEVSWIYGLVEAAVNDVLKTHELIVHQSVSHGAVGKRAAEVMLVRAAPTVEARPTSTINETNIPEECCELITRPSSSSCIVKRSDSVETSHSGLHSASSQRSTQSSAGSQRPDSNQRLDSSQSTLIDSSMPRSTSSHDDISSKTITANDSTIPLPIPCSTADSYSTEATGTNEVKCYNYNIDTKI